jgi:hypothetical protein
MLEHAPSRDAMPYLKRVIAVEEFSKAMQILRSHFDSTLERGYR